LLIPPLWHVDAVKGGGVYPIVYEQRQRVSENLAAIEDFCSRLEVLPYGAKAAQYYGGGRQLS